MTKSSSGLHLNSDLIYSHGSIFMKTLSTLILFFSFAFLVGCGESENASHNSEDQETVDRNESDHSGIDKPLSEGDDDAGSIEKEIDPSSLPASIKEAIESKYPGSELIEADEITHADGKVTYDVEIKHDDSITELMYDAEANFLGIEADEDQDEDGDEEGNDEVNDYK